MKKLILLAVLAMTLTGCANARHPQCNHLKARAEGAEFGAIIAGTIDGNIRARQADNLYEMCEYRFDVQGQ